MNNWEKVFNTDQAYQAEIVKAVLVDRGLSAVIINKQDSSYSGAFSGQMEVYVPLEEAVQAVNIIYDEIRFD